jgi:CRP-like cAMP-binding protein
VLLPVTKTALAARLGVTKETISRLLRTLREQGLIEMTRRKITILDRARLAGIAS